MPLSSIFLCSNSDTKSYYETSSRGNVAAGGMANSNQPNGNYINLLNSLKQEWETCT